VNAAGLIIGATSPGGKTAGLATLRESRVNAAAYCSLLTRYCFCGQRSIL
jgi:hypothetical protein